MFIFVCNYPKLFR